MRKKIIAANWKMNLNWQEATALFEELYTLEGDSEIVIFPSSIYIATFSAHLKRQKQSQSITTIGKNNSSFHDLMSNPHTIKLGVQNVHQAEKGAYTGEISLQQVKSIGGIKYVLVGHSERRQYFNETDQSVKLKVDACLKNGFTPIICVGEPIDIRNRQQEKEYVTNQIETSLFHLTDEQIQQCVIAYEPIWAIGTGNSATSQQAEDMHRTIRECIAKKYSNNTAKKISILYGGSCTPNNAHELFACPNIDGGLIGGASLDFTSFSTIIRACNNA